jgi:hypothetical protein
METATFFSSKNGNSHLNRNGLIKGWRGFFLLAPFQITRYSKNLGELKHLKFDQNYRENYKNL